MPFAVAPNTIEIMVRSETVKTQPDMELGISGREYLNNSFWVFLSNDLKLMWRLILVGITFINTPMRSASEYAINTPSMPVLKAVSAIMAPTTDRADWASELMVNRTFLPRPLDMNCAKPLKVLDNI